MKSIPPIRPQDEFHITGDWGPVSRKLLENFDQLTESDIVLRSGSEEELLTKIMNRLRMRRDEVIHMIQQMQRVARN